MSSVILLSMLMMLLPRITTVTSRIGFWRNWNGTGGGLLISMLVSFDWSNNTDAINVKMDGSVLEKKYSLKSMGLSFSSILDWSIYIISIAKTAYKKIAALIRSMKCLSPEVDLYLYKSTIRLYMKHFCHFWAGAPSCYLELLEKLKKGFLELLFLDLLSLLKPWL